MVTKTAGKTKTKTEPVIMKKDDADVPIPSNRLSILRNRSRLTQEEVAAICGIDFTTVSRHENATRRIDDDAIRRYARLFKCSSYELFMQPDNDDEYTQSMWSHYKGS